MKDVLLLFDIDGTLLDSGEAGTRALNKAFQSLFGIDDAFRGISMAGKTDTQIIKEALSLHGIDSRNGVVESVMNRYIELLKVEIDNPRKRLKPGVKEVLHTITDLGLPMGLLTGNIEPGARIKLGAFDLNRYFPAGAFGSDHDDRDMLLPIALQRFARLGVEVPPQRCVIIGDTPRDVRCSKIHGGRCIAVCTGPYDADTLQDAGADLVLESLEDRERFLQFLAAEVN